MKKIFLLIVCVFISYIVVSQDLTIENVKLSSEIESIDYVDSDINESDINTFKPCFICKFNPGSILADVLLNVVIPENNFFTFHCPLTFQWMFNPKFSLDFVLDTLYFVEYSCNLGLTYYFSDASPNGIYTSVSVGASTGLSIVSGHLFSPNASASVGYQYLFGKTKKWLVDGGLGVSWYGSLYKLSPNLNLSIGRIF